MGADINKTFDLSYLYTQKFIPDADTQVMFNESIKKTFTLPF